MIPHGIMFHHFHDQTHSSRPGAISGEQLAALIEHLGVSRVLSAGEWTERASAGRLDPEHLCITFDDALLCQYDVAVPVLADYGIKAFWFVYTSIFVGTIELLEVYRKFRSVAFEDVEAFYSVFFDILDATKHAGLVAAEIGDYDPHTYLAEFPFYSEGDRRFRYVRDRILGQDRYAEVMNAMLEEYQIDVETFSQDLWMRDHHLRRLHEDGHIIGLHSHTHPTTLSEMSEAMQREEYETNHRVLTSILDAPLTTMAHPCNSYNDMTLAVLRDMGVRLGFCSNMSKPALSELEHPREDHVNVMKRITI